MNQSKIRFSMSVRPDPSDAELLFARQLGVPCVYTWVSPEQRSYEYLARLREKVEGALGALHAPRILTRIQDHLAGAATWRDVHIAVQPEGVIGRLDHFQVPGHGFLRVHGLAALQCDYGQCH